MSEIEQKNIISSTDDKYIIHINNFDGPLDVLWDLIKKSKIDVTEVTISDITEQYIDFLKLMKKLNVGVATEFIRMASELLFYKSSALLPAGQIEDEYFVPPLPPGLIQKLLEYKKFQHASLKLKQEYETCADKFYRNNNLSEIIDDEEYIDVSLFDLLKAFAEVMESQNKPEQDEIVFDEILVSDRIEYIKDILKEKDVVLFTEIFIAKPSRAEIVASFLAILEMSRTRIVGLLQHKIFGNIRIVRFSINGNFTG